MTSAFQRIACVAGCTVILFLAGCYGQAKDSVTKTGPAATGSMPTTAEAEDHSRGTALSDEDKALVAAQRLCPVTDEDLMADEEMGGPVKLVVKGETVFICCKGCEKKARADEDATLAKVAELKKSKPAGDTPNN